MRAHPNFIHKIPSTKIHNKIICFMLVISCVSSLYLLPNSILPNGEVQVTIWLFYKIDFSGLSNPLCQIAESTGPNCESMLPSQHFQATNSTSPRQRCQIVKSKFALSTAHDIKTFWTVQGLNVFKSAETSAQKNQIVLFSSPPPPPPLRKKSSKRFLSFF
jgi:hypothetical protein